MRSESVARGRVLEIALESALTHQDPFWDVDIQVAFTGPSGQRRIVDGFWDGGSVWRVRFAPNEPGTWHWVTVCSRSNDTGLHAREGSFECYPYDDSNPLYRHGRLQLAENRCYLAWEDGTPFFWMGDTAWNGVLRATAEDWDRYLTQRAAQGFTVIQFVCTQWRGATRVLGSERAFSLGERIQLHPEFFQRRDAKVAAVNAHGLVAAPVMLWALTPEDPGQALPEADAIRLARYLAARWGAYQVVWILGGDGRYLGEHTERWCRIGRAVFGGEKERLVTMHPCGQSWVGEAFRGEPWYDIIGYQSGHGSSDEHLRWLVMGPPARQWRREPTLPVINLEPNYEMHPSYHEARVFTDYEVRRAAYWSLLVSPTAGVTYGVNPIWVWAAQEEVPEGHQAIGPVAPWHVGLATPGVRSIRLLHEFFEALPWWQLRPAPEMLAAQPGQEDPRRFVAAAKTEDGRLGVIYVPVASPIVLRHEAIPDGSYRWFDPRRGAWEASGVLSSGKNSFTPPGDGDWLLCLGMVDRLGSARQER